MKGINCQILGINFLGETEKLSDLLQIKQE